MKEINLNSYTNYFSLSLKDKVELKKYFVQILPNSFL